MALDQSVCTDLLEAFKTSDGVDLIRDAVRYVFQELIESEATGVIGAGPYERTEGRVTERNGHRVRLVSTKARRRRARHPQAQEGELLPLDPRAPPAHRPGPLRRGDGGLRGWDLDP